MASLKVQKRLAANLLNCGKGKVWLDPCEALLISMANSSMYSIILITFEARDVKLKSNFDTLYLLRRFPEPISETHQQFGWLVKDNLITRKPNASRSRWRYRKGNLRREGYGKRKGSKAAILLLWMRRCVEANPLKVQGSEED
ncbi:hypothetical protein V6N13_017023 [Hibiscus sabdariffa]